MMPSDLPHLIPWSWVASRSFLSIFMVLSWLAWRREKIDPDVAPIDERTVYFGTVIFTLFSFWFFCVCESAQSLLSRDFLPPS